MQNKAITGAAAKPFTKRMVIKGSSPTFYISKNGRLVIKSADYSNEKIANILNNFIASNPELANKKISFLWTNGTKIETQEIAGFLGSPQPDVFENTPAGKSMEANVIKRLREYDNANGQLHKDVRDEDLWMEMFRNLHEELNVIDKRRDTLSDLLEKKDSDNLRALDAQLEESTKAYLPDAATVRLYNFRRELVKFQRNESKKYADSIKDNYVILVRRGGKSQGTANRAETRVLYRHKKSNIKNTDSRPLTIIDAEIVL